MRHSEFPAHLSTGIEIDNGCHRYLFNHMTSPYILEDAMIGAVVNIPLIQSVNLIASASLMHVSYAVRRGLSRYRSVS